MLLRSSRVVRSASTSSNNTTTYDTTKQPKRVSICGVHEISPSPPNVDVATVNCYNQSTNGFLCNPSELESHQNQFHKSRSFSSHEFIKPSRIHPQSIGDVSKRSVVARSGIKHHEYSAAPTNVTLPLDTSCNFMFTRHSFLLRLQQIQLAEMEKALGNSVTKDAAISLLCLRHSPSMVSKPDGTEIPKELAQVPSIEDDTEEVKTPSLADTLKTVIPPSTVRARHLSMPEDKGNVNSLHRFVRSELLEIFEPSMQTEEDQALDCRVGFRCVYCSRARSRNGKSAPMSCFFPKSLEGIYRGVCTWQRLHFAKCSHVPRAKTRKYRQLKQSDKSRGTIAYWSRSAFELGLRNISDKNEGIMWWQAGNDAIHDLSGAD